MNESRTSMNAGAAAGADVGYGNARSGYDNDSRLGFETQKNPFTDPGDEEIFTFKEKERERKDRERL